MQNPKDIIKEPVLNIREPSAAIDSVSFLLVLSNVRYLIAPQNLLE